MGKYKHKDFTKQQFFNSLLEELRYITDFELQVLRSHLYIEYQINSVIIKKFRNPEFVLDDVDSYSFSKKLTLLKALGVFEGEGEEELYNNLITINKIRNSFAHILDKSESEEKVRSLVFLLTFPKDLLTDQKIVTLREEETAKRFREVITPLILRLEALYDTC